MNKKEKMYTIIWHQDGQEDQIKEHVNQLCASMLPIQLEMAFPEKFANETMWVEVILEK